MNLVPRALIVKSKYINMFYLILTLSISIAILIFLMNISSLENQHAKFLKSFTKKSVQ